jgi:hypothetical protein
MDERDIEEEGKDIEGEGWGIGIKKVISIIFSTLKFLNKRTIIFSMISIF